MMAVRQVLVTLLMGWLYIGNVNAIPITMNADDYAVGTDITNANKHITLQQYEHFSNSSITYSSVIVSDSGLGFNKLGPGYREALDSCNYPTAYCPGGIPNPTTYWAVLEGYNSLSNAGYFSGLSISSDQAISAFSWTGSTFTGTTFILHLFDKNDNYISSIYERYNVSGICGYEPDGTAHYCETGQYNLDFTGQDVYRIAWSGAYDNAWLDSFAINVPEPSSLALLAIGLLGLGFVNERRKCINLTLHVFIRPCFGGVFYACRMSASGRLQISSFCCLTPH